MLGFPLAQVSYMKMVYLLAKHRKLIKSRLVKLLVKGTLTIEKMYEKSKKPHSSPVLPPS